MAAVLDKRWASVAILTGLLGSAWVSTAGAQNTPAPSQEPAESAPAQQPLPPSKGQVIIQSHGEPATGTEVPARPGNGPAQPVVDANAVPDVSDAERAAPLFTAYDLDARLNPARAGLNVRAQVTVRNDGAVPLKQLVLQLSSTLHWDSATLLEGAARTRLPLAQHQLETDADHTGAETEAIFSLPRPLAPGASVVLDLFYSGTVSQSAARFDRLGASVAQQRSNDWDAIGPRWTGLRGFGDVLWYPVATPQLFFADGNGLFEAIGRTRLREKQAKVHLRLSVEYGDGAPAAAYFCGRRQGFASVSDAPDAPVTSDTGVATADFPTEPLGFRTPSLFVLQLPESFPSASAVAGEASTPAEFSSSVTPPAAAAQAQAAPATSRPDAAGNGEASPFLAVVTDDAGATASFAAAANHVAPLLREWLGPRPLSSLTVLDHDGQPFQDGPLLVGPLASLAASSQSSALVQSLTHAWIQTGQPWMDEGLAEFFGLLWVERELGGTVARAQLTELTRPVAIAEPELSNATGAGKGQPLVEAADDLFYRRKAAAVWWMLRGLVGDGALHQALSAWRTQPSAQAPAAEQAVAFEHLLERLSGKDLGWFFADWVLRDRGLPDLSITAVAASPQTSTPGHPSGFLVAVTVRNEGGAVADVPLILRSGTNHIEQRIRIPALSSATQRVLIETAPTGVQVNDGSVPEIGSSIHTRPINLQTR